MNEYYEDRPHFAKQLFLNVLLWCELSSWTSTNMLFHNSCIESIFYQIHASACDFANCLFFRILFCNSHKSRRFPDDHWLLLIFSLMAFGIWVLNVSFSNAFDILALIHTCPHTYTQTFLSLVCVYSNGVSSDPSVWIFFGIRDKTTIQIKRK